jgi:hypothetical protein
MLKTSKLVFIGLGLSLSLSSAFAYKVEQTICFSQRDTGQKIGNREFYMASLGDNAILNGGKCQGRTLIQMNRKGWKLIQVISDVNEAFGMVLEKK